MPLTRDDVYRAADALLATEGPPAVSLRRIRQHLGSGSLSTIHRFLAEWKATHALNPPVTGATVAEPSAPVVFLPPAEAGTDRAAEILVRHISRYGDIDIRQGPPEGLVHLVHPYAEAVARAASIRFAPALTALGSSGWERRDPEQALHVTRSGTWVKTHQGIAVTAGDAAFITAVCGDIDTFLQENSKAELFSGIDPALDRLIAARRRELARLTLQIERDLYDRLAAKAQRSGRPLHDVVAAALRAAV